jgi:hypothetical protein
VLHLGTPEAADEIKNHDIFISVGVKKITYSTIPIIRVPIKRGSALSEVN